ncbi:MAG: type II secretion system F family protein [Roseiarcus sp.]|jgi:tight adherence protein C
MLDLLIEKLSDGRFMAGLLVALGCAATVLTLAMPLLQTDNLGRRMKAVSTERERIRQRERERMAVGQTKAALRVAPKRLFKNVVDKLNLTSWLGTERAKMQLAMAGYRGAGAEYTFLFFRLVTPVALFLTALLYLFVLLHWDKPALMKFGIAIGAMYLGIKAPEIFLSNTIAKRKKSMERAYPNTLDLLLICVESGMSIEHAFRKVSMEVGTESIPMAEEMTLLAAEMSYLPDRRTAFENLGARTGLESIRALVTVLVQAERYGTPLGAALRVLSQESRDARMNAAEKKAASLPPALTVPMIIFFLPGLFAAILTPAIIQINQWT